MTKREVKAADFDFKRSKADSLTVLANSVLIFAK